MVFVHCRRVLLKKWNPCSVMTRVEGEPHFNDNQVAFHLVMPWYWLLYHMDIEFMPLSEYVKHYAKVLSRKSCSYYQPFCWGRVSVLNWDLKFILPKRSTWIYGSQCLHMTSSFMYNITPTWLCFLDVSYIVLEIILVVLSWVLHGWNLIIVLRFPCRS